MLTLLTEHPRPAPAPSPDEWRVPLHALEELVLDYFDVPKEYIRSYSRGEHAAYVRNCFFWLANTYSWQSLPAIGRYFGRNHSSVLTGRNRIDTYMSDNDDVADDIAAMMADIAERYPQARRKNWARKVRGGRQPFLGEEDKVQAAMVQYLRLVLPKAWKVHSSPNGGLSKRANARAKIKGTLRGWTDIEIAGQETLDLGEDETLTLPMMYFIEVKTQEKHSKVEDHQRDLHDDLKKLGFRVGVARSLDELKELILSWNLPVRDALLRPR